MAQADAYRELVEARAGGACEYCRLLQAATGVTFHIEHVLPRSQGGETVMSNLALSCPGCNLAKRSGRPAKTKAVKNNLSSIRATSNRGSWVGISILLSTATPGWLYLGLPSAKRPSER